jgi:hypothetical protein
VGRPSVTNDVGRLASHDPTAATLLDIDVPGDLPSDPQEPRQT